MFAFHWIQAKERNSVGHLKTGYKTKSRHLYLPFIFFNGQPPI